MTPAPISVRPTEDGHYWRVNYDCCDTPPMRFREWITAKRVAFGHTCPPTIPAVVFNRPKRLTRTIR